MTTVKRNRIWVHKNELIDSLEIFSEDKRRYYSFTYKITNRNGKERNLVRWDNHELGPHVDRYDEASNLIEQAPAGEKSLRDIITLVTIYRQNLLAMNLSEL